MLTKRLQNIRTLTAVEFEAECQSFSQDFTDYFYNLLQDQEKMDALGDFFGDGNPDISVYKGNLYLPSKYADEDSPDGVSVMAFGAFSFMNSLPVIVGLWSEQLSTIHYLDMLPFFASMHGPQLINDANLILMNRKLLTLILEPMELRYEEKSSSSEAQVAISALRKTFDVYRQTYGTTENYTVERALEDAHIGPDTREFWVFEVTGNPPRMFIATSTSAFPVGPNKKIWYDVDQAKFHGYGVDQYENPHDY